MRLRILNVKLLLCPHLVQPLGAFNKIAKEVLKNSAHGIKWGTIGIDQKELPLTDPDDPESGEGEGESEPKAKKSSKVKFTCPRCGQNAWGKPDLNILCAACPEIEGVFAVMIKAPQKA